MIFAKDRHAGFVLCERVARVASEGAHETEYGGTYVTIDDVIDAYRAQRPTDEQRVAMVGYLQARGVLDCKALDPAICEGILKIS